MALTSTLKGHARVLMSGWQSGYAVACKATLRGFESLSGLQIWDGGGTGRRAGFRFQFLTE